MPSVKHKKWQAVEIFWLDSVGSSKWMYSKEFEGDEKYIFHRSIGYYLGQTEKTIQLVQSYQEYIDDGHRNVDHMLQIPKGAIVKVRKL